MEIRAYCDKKDSDDGQYSYFFLYVIILLLASHKLIALETTTILLVANILALVLLVINTIKAAKPEYHFRNIDKPYRRLIEFVVLVITALQISGTFVSNELDVVLAILTIVDSVLISNEKKSAYNARDHREFTLSCDHNKITYDGSNELLYEDFHTISFSNGTLVFSGEGSPVRFNIREKQQDKVQMLEKMFYENNYCKGFVVDHSGSTINIIIQKGEFCEKTLKKQIDEIERLLVMDKVSISYLQGGTHEYAFEPQKGIWEQIHNHIGVKHET